MATRKTFAFLESPVFTGTVTIPTPFTLGAVSVLPTGTELNFVDGVTSNIQTQLDGKQASGSYGLTTNPLSQFAATTSLQLLGVISDEVGTGALMFATSPTITTSLIMADAANIVINATTGTKIGTAITEKLAFHNSTPVAQRAGAAQAAVATTASTQTTPFGYSTAAQADGIITLLNELRAALVEKGIIKGAV